MAYCGPDDIKLGQLIIICTIILTLWGWSYFIVAQMIPPVRQVEEYIILYKNSIRLSPTSDTLGWKEVLAVNIAWHVLLHFTKWTDYLMWLNADFIPDDSEMTHTLMLCNIDATIVCNHVSCRPPSWNFTMLHPIHYGKCEHVKNVNTCEHILRLLVWAQSVSLPL